MICPNCKAELPIRSKFCQVCGAPQPPQMSPPPQAQSVSAVEIPEKPKNYSSLLLVGGIIVAVVLLCLLASNPGNTASVPDESADVVPEVVEPAFYGVGDTATAASYILTIESAGIATSNNMFIQPDEGYEYFEVVMTFENTTDSNLTISSLLDFDAYLDGFAISAEIFASDITSVDTIGGTMAAGKKIRGALCYEVPVGWSELEILVSAGYGSDNEKTILIYNDSSNLAASSTSENASDGSATVTLSEELKPYGVILDYYIESYNKGWEQTDNVNYQVMYADALGDIGYAFEDFNGDGVMEMLIAFVDSPDVAIEVYSMIDGSLERIISGGERDRYYVTDRGIFSNFGSSSAFSSEQSYLAIADNGELVKIASITYFTSSDDSMSYYYFNYLSGGSEPSELSWEEKQAIEKSYQVVALTYTPLAISYQADIQSAWNAGSMPN